MRKYILVISLFIISFFSTNSYPATGTGNPLKYISSCELDFNNDSEPDIALLVETLLGRRLIVLLKTEEGYNAFVVSKEKSGMHLTCHFGKEIKETTAGHRKGKTYRTPGTYIKLTQPEGSSVVYFWNGKRFYRSLDC